MIPASFDDVDFADVGKRTIERTDRSLSSELSDDSRKSKQLCEDIHRALLATGQMWLRDVAVAAHANGRIVLQGCVPTYYLKQLAQSITLAVVGVKSLENQIAVK